jgi:NADH:ubiquinone oxidoreductase subunit 2 (subunit N)
MFTTFFQNNFVYLLTLSFLPEFLLLVFISCLILVAVKRKDSSTPNFSLLLPRFLNLTTYFFVFCAIYWALYLIYIPFDSVTVFYFFNTLKINSTLLLIKIILSLLVAVSLYSAKRYLLLNNLMYYEYPIVISLAVFGMYISLMANNWMILFVALELQALCFLTLFAWNKKNVKSITAALKFSIVNFVASILILLAFVEIILTTQTLNMYLSNPFFFLKNLVQYYTQESLVFDPQFVMWLQQQMTVLFKIYYTVDLSNMFANTDLVQMIVTNPAIFLAKVLKLMNMKVLLFWDFIGFLLILGFAIKLGLVPFGMWLQDLYNGVALPVLTFFGTAPKLVYLTIISSMYINLFAYINNQHFLNILGLFGVISIIIGNFAMFSVRNNLLQLLAWSSISNMGLLFFLVAFFPYYSFSLVFMLYYTVGTLLFFVGLQYIIIKDQTGAVRQVLYFTDLSIVRYHPQYRILFLTLMISLLNFFGIPPLVGFWMKLSVYYGIMVAMTNFTAVQWGCILFLLLITLVGSYNYLRLLYVILSENHLPKLTMVYLPNTKHDVMFLGKIFVFIQFFFFISYKYFIMNFSFSKLLMLYTVSI